MTCPVSIAWLGCICNLSEYLVGCGIWCASGHVRFIVNLYVHTVTLSRWLVQCGVRCTPMYPMYSIFQPFLRYRHNTYRVPYPMHHWTHLVLLCIMFLHQASFVLCLELLHDLLLTSMSLVVSCFKVLIFFIVMLFLSKSMLHPLYYIYKH